MNPVYQTRRGNVGNCWAACLASMLELPLEATDHCGAPHTEWWYNTQAMLAEHGFFYVEIELGPKDEAGNQAMPCTVPPDGVLLMVGCNTERQLPHVVIGRFNHVKDDAGVAVGWNIEIVHDPMPGGSDEYKIDALIFLCRLQR